MLFDLPNGEQTEDTKLYEKQWKSLTKKVFPHSKWISISYDERGAIQIEDGGVVIGLTKKFIREHSNFH